MMTSPLEIKDGSGGASDEGTAETISEINEAVKRFIDRNEAETKALKVQLAAEKKRVDALEKKSNRPNLGSDVAPNNKIDPAALALERKAMAAFVRSDGNGDLSEVKAMSVSTDPDGGYLVLPQRSSVMTTRLYEESPVRRLARNVTMTTGDAFEEPFDIDNVEAIWVGEKQARPETDSPKLGLLNIPLQEVYANPKATQKLLDTSYIDIGAWLDGKINDRFARSDAESFVSGDGINRPRGFLNYDTTTENDFDRAWGKLQYIKTGAATAFAAVSPGDVLRDLVWSLRAPYRKNAVFLMNSLTASVIDKFKNGTGDYIWRDGMTAGAPPILCGYPVEIDENMPALGANTYPIAFGNFALGYTIPERPGLKMLRDPFTDKPNVFFYAYRRVGGGVSNFDAIKLLKCEA
ncbi:MAG: phage major capsid protein [Rhizobiales bacterium]|nr:phage major capsid protein [Hyphomicrobiales bacterium]